MTQPLSAQTVRGLVLERVTERPVELGSVTLVEPGGDTVAVAVTDARGFFSVTADGPGESRLMVDAFGHRRETVGPFDLGAGGLRVVQVSLEPAPVGISGIDVEASETVSPYLVRQGFTERREMGHGHFLGPRELDDLRTILSSTEDIFYRLHGLGRG